MTYKAQDGPVKRYSQDEMGGRPPCLQGWKAYFEKKVSEKQDVVRQVKLCSI